MTGYQGDNISTEIQFRMTTSPDVLGSSIFVQFHRGQTRYLSLMIRELIIYDFLLRLKKSCDHVRQTYRVL